MVLVDVLGQRWTLRILWEMRGGRLTFRELQERCGGVSPTVLNERLRTLRELDIVDHSDGGYGMTAQGAALGRELGRLDRWANQWAQGLP
jgi:DNA-binding HxlR family transcriptional regulator